VFLDRDGWLERVVAGPEEAAAGGARLVVFPEKVAAPPKSVRTVALGA
jgi:predicted amidohydrolase